MNQDYLPFGGDLPKAGQTEVMNDEGEKCKYTGQMEVVSIGLYYYGARYYDPDVGRFITEDTYDGELVDPQSQNVYIYVMNNPLKYVDPSGNEPLSLFMLYFTIVANSPDTQHDMELMAINVAEKDYSGAALDLIGTAIPGVNSLSVYKDMASILLNLL